MKSKLAQLQRLEKDSSSDDDDSSNAELSDDSGDDEKLKLMTERDAKILEQRIQSETKKKDVVPYRNKQRVMLLCSRGITTRFRHFMEDIRALLPHHRKEVKHDTKKRLFEINELCEMKSCNGCLFFEIRKKQDLYLWATRAPNGPSIKFLVTNLHTMDELQMTGNCLLGSRPLLSFSSEFDKIPYLQLTKEMLSLTFGTPKGHPKSKPFVDRVMQFTLLDGRIWMRNYQIVDETKDEREITKAEKLGEETFLLSEIGPRCVLTVMKIFDGGFGGRPIYENPKYVSPNEMRAQVKRQLGEKYVQRKKSVKLSEEHLQEALDNVPIDELSNKRVFS